MSGEAQDSPNAQHLTATIDRRNLLRLAMSGVTGATLVAVLAACGGSSPSTSTSTSTSSQPAASASGSPSVGAAASPAASGATPSAAASTPSNAKVTVAQGVDIKSFDPHVDTSSAALAIFLNVFDHLVARDQNLKFIPGLAESWTTLNDTTWEFKIRQGVKFHDGTSFTANDMKFTINYVLDPKNNSPQRTRIAGIDHAEAPDDSTFHIVTKTPLPALLDELSENIFALPAAAYQSMGTQKFALAPIGTGPYKFVEWVRDSHVTLERFDGYWGTKASIQTAEYRPIAEDATRVAALQAGELTIAALIPPTDIPTLQASSKLDVRTIRSIRTDFVGMNCFKPPFTDVRVRQALNYAVDIPSIIKDILGGHGYQNANVCAASAFGYDPNLKPYTYDPEKAKSLLKEAGLANGFSTTLDTPQGRYLDDVEVAQAIAGQLGAVGIKVEVKPAEFNEYFNRWLAKKIEGLYFLGFGGATDADGVLGSHFDSKRRGLYYNSPQSDDLIHQSMAELDTAKRENLYHQLMGYLHDQAPWIFLYDEEDIYGVVKTLKWQPVADERISAFDMSFS